MALFVLIDGSVYKMDGSMSCASRNVNGSCNKWTLSSSIDHHDATVKCFPGDSFVMTRHGPVQMKNLYSGHDILGYDHTTNSVTFTPFITWLHFEKTGTYEFVEITTSTGKLVASDHHNI